MAATPTDVPAARPSPGEAWRAFKGTIIYQALHRQRRWLGLLLGCTMLSLGVVVVTIATIKRVFDDALITHTKPLDPLVGTLVLFAILSFFTSLATSQVASRVVYQLECDMRCWLYDQLQAVEPTALDRLSAGQLVTRALTDLSFLEGLTSVLPVAIIAVVVLVAAAIVMVVINPLMGVVTLIAIPVNASIVKGMARRLRALSWLSLHRRAEVTTRIDEPVRGIRVVKAFDAEHDEEARVGAAAAGAYEVAMERIRLLARFGIAVKLIPLVLNAVLVFLGAYYAVHGSFTIGALAVYLGFATFFTALAAQVDEVVSAWQYATSGTSRIFELVTDAAPPEDGLDRLPPAPTSGLVAVGVRAEGGAPAHLAVAPGTWVAITGSPGCGTSAMARMVVGAEAPIEGSVELDGVPLDRVDRSELRRAVRLVDAEPFLFGRTVRENLVMGAGVGETVDEPRMWAALAAAAADDFVRQLPHGLDGSVGDRGLTLSGGQRQRLALARALVSPPRLLVLDEALAAVNATLEVEILRSVRSYAPEMAVLVVSRRPGPLAVVDEVVVLADPVVALGDPWAAEPDPASFERPSDPVLAGLVDALDLVAERPPVTEGVAVADHEVPTVRNVLSPVSGKVAVAMGILLVLTSLTIAPDVLLEFLVNGIRHHTVSPAIRVAMALVPIAVAVTAVTFVLRIVITQINESVLYVLRRRVFRRLTRLGVDYYDRELPGKVASRVVYDLDRITEFVNGGVFAIATSAFLLLGATVTLAVVSPNTFAGVAPFLPVLVLATAVEVPLADRAYRNARDKLGVVVERFHEDFTGRYVISSFGGDRQARAGFAALSWDLRQARRRATTTANVYLALISSVSALATAVLISRAGHLALHNSATIGRVVFLEVLLTQALAPLPTLSGVLQTYLNAKASFRTLGQPFQAPVLPVVSAEVVACPALDGALRLDAVTFRYPGTDRTVLDDVTVAVAPGEVVALVGPTGAGKSSVTKLLARTYDPEGGTVTVDGHDLRTLHLGSYRRRLGVVPQDAFCFRGTVGSNIGFGRPEAGSEELAGALSACGGGEVLAGLPAGLETEVQEEGRNLTPSARQWVALARAWLVEPDVLILDEATSALSPDAEQAVVEALRARGRTAIIVTHRQSVAARADRVIVIDGGRVVADGSHHDLMAISAYLELWADGVPAPAARPRRVSAE